MLKLKVKKLTENAKLPAKAHPTDACYDFYTPMDVVLPPKTVTKVNLDIAVECPDQYKLCFYSRSGLASRGIIVSNGVGIVDQNYRGCCAVLLYNSTDRDFEFHKGDRIIQGSLEKVIQFEIEETDTLSETDRGSGGFGSTGK